MNIHEYQAKELLNQFGIPTPQGKVASTPEEAQQIADSFESSVAVVKAQIHAGGRGKGGGVKVVKDKSEVRTVASQILGMQLVTHQTGPEGKTVSKVLVEQGLAIATELYAGVVLDRNIGMPVLMASSEGGVDIEEVAANTPEKILKEAIDARYGLRPFQARRLAKALGLSGRSLKEASGIFIKLARLCVETDASLVEINPLIVTEEGGVLALDAKFNVDDNALYRHKNIAAYRDLSEEDPKEVEAKKYGLSYISLDGTIGCMVNGAGLAMSTMDIIKLHGSSPANFLDVGGGANQEKVAAAFRIILGDPNVKAILVNIFGGIMKCDVIALGVIEAARELGVGVPLVVRLEGTNVKQGRALLAESGLNIIRANDMTDAAEKVVAAAKGE